MPSQIVKLDELVPEDHVFEYQGSKYLIPGDLDTETRFRFGRLFRDLAQAETETVTAQKALLEWLVQLR